MSISYEPDVEDRWPASRHYWAIPIVGDDVDTLLHKMPALPFLRAARITAVRRYVGPVDMSCMSHLEHLALGCAELTLRNAAGGSVRGPKSLHIIMEKASPQTVGLLADGFFPRQFASLSWTHTCFKCWGAF